MKRVLTIAVAAILAVVCFSLSGCIPTTEKGIIKKMEAAGYTTEISTDETHLADTCELFMITGLVKIIQFSDYSKENGSMTVYCFTSVSEAKKGYEKIKERAERLKITGTAQGMAGKFVYGGYTEATDVLRA